jgi:predicted extracellular nuclease
MSLIGMSAGLSGLASTGLAAVQVPGQGASDAPKISTTVVISEFRTRGPVGGNDEFIELFNLSNNPVDIGGWKINGSNSSGVVSTRATITNGITLQPGQHYLLVNTASGGYSGSVPGDGPGYTTGIGDDGGIALLDAANVIIDQVGMSTGSAYGEGNRLPNFGSTNSDRSYRRVNECVDTDDNVADFGSQTVSPSTPQNRSFAFTPCGTATPAPTNTPGGPTATPTNSPTSTLAPSFTATATNTPMPRRIYEIQGAQHRSPLVGQRAGNVPGIVTARLSNGFYMQDPNPDSDPATSEGILVFTSSAPTVNVGDAVLVTGTIAEFRPGGSGGTNNLATTQLSSPVIVVQSTGNPLPTTVVIGTGGRIPPTEIINNDSSGDVETSGVFDPAEDGIDFYESMEGMRVQVNNPVAVGPRNSFGEIPVLGDDGANASVRTMRGGIIVRPTPGPQYCDCNPERIILDDVITTTPNVHVGDHFGGPAIGIMDYNFGNFKLQITQPLSAVPSGLMREVTTPQGPNQIAMGNFNVENLDPTDPQSKFDALADQIVNNMKSPDIISVQEVQDNDGPANTTVVDASQTYGMLIAAIQAAGGPTYEFRNVNPVDDQDGGEPGGNIRQGFLFRTDRGVAFIDRPGGCSTCDTTVVSGPNGPELSYSPGRIMPTATAFASSRKPLVGEFTYNGHKLFLIGNHFNSKGGDQPLFGRFQPPTRSSEIQRNQQAQIVNDFVDAVLAQDANANIAILGDINDFWFSPVLMTLKGGVLNDLVETLPMSERYTYVFDGNSQDLDHILASNNLMGALDEYDPIHVNAEFYDQISDHDPQVARFTLWPGCVTNPDYLVMATAEATMVPATNYVPGSTCNSCIVTIPLPFTYTLYNTAYNSVNASNKGNLQFNTSSTTGENTCLPTTALGDAIMPYWDALNTNINDTMGIYTSTTGTAPNRVFNIRWKAGFERSDARVEFEVLLYEGQPRFEIIYGAMTATGSSATVGVQKGDGTRFTQYECNTAGTIQSGMRLVFDRRSCPGVIPGKK